MNRLLSAKRDRCFLPLRTATLELGSEKAHAHSGEIFSVAFSPDGTQIVSASADQTIKVWDSGAAWPSNQLGP